MGRLKLSAVFVSVLFLLAVAAVLNGWQLYFMATALLAVPVVSYVLGVLAISKIRCKREAPEYAGESEPIEVSVRVECKHQIVGPIHIRDTLPKWFQPISEEENVERHSAMLITFKYRVLPMKRGAYKLGPVEVNLTDPLGFFNFKRRHRIFSDIIVYPSPLRIPELEARLGGTFGEHQFEGTGAKGSGVDFHGVRNYQPGDDLRRVHWRSTARHRKLNVIEFEHRAGQDTVIAINVKKGSQVGTPPLTSLEYSAKLAAGISEQALSQGNSVRLLYPGVSGRASTLGSGITQFYAILEALAVMETNERESLSGMLQREIESIDPNSVVICLSPEVEDDMLECVELFNSRSIKTLLILVTLSSTLSHVTQMRISELASRGSSIAVVRCSASEVMAELEYQYAG